MKKILLMLSMALSLLLVSCGGSGEDESGEFYDIVREKITVFDEKEGENYFHAGTQYYHGEPVQIWAERSSGFNEAGEYWAVRDFYILREDGTRELLVAGIDVETVPHGKWWVDEQERIFVLETDGLKSFDRQGNLRFHTKTDENVVDICALENGKYMLVLYHNGEPRLAEVNPDTGKISICEKVSRLSDYYIAPNGNELMLAGGGGVVTLNPEDGKKEYIMSWSGTSYSWAWSFVGDFRLQEDGSVEILYENGTLERLRYEKLSDGKIPITLRHGSTQGWLKEQIVVFNQTNEKYYVILEECEDLTQYQTFKERTDMLLAAGQGADIILYPSIQDFDGLLEKGAFENLSPYLKKSGIRQEDYFEGTFVYGEDGKELIGANLGIVMRSFWMDGELAERIGEMNIENLLEQLKQWEDRAVFLEGAGANSLLSLWLEGSKDLWGMVDWEKGSCDFDCSLFRDMAEMAARYGDSENNGYPALTGLLLYWDVYTFADEYREMAEEGRTAVGLLLDDGSFPFQGYSQLALINANSKHKEGAWEVLEFLLSQEAQENWGEYGWTDGYPVNRESFRLLREFCFQREEEDSGNFYFTEEQMDALEREIESIHAEPTKNLPICDIIYEEMAAYFSGVKPLEEVIAVIENRVQLYLDEIS